MVLQPRAGRSTDDRQVWLSMLIGAMEDAARPERRAIPCARSTLAALRAQLAHSGRHRLQPLQLIRTSQSLLAGDFELRLASARLHFLAHS
jgi:hypothetical protein